MRFILSEKNQYIILFLLFSSLSILFIITNHTFLGIQDETQLQATLKAGDVFNYDTSYPLAVIVGFLYSTFPNLEWYSIMMTFYVIVIMGLLTLYIVKIDLGKYWLTILFKLALFILSLIILTHMMLQIDVATLTLLLVVLAVPLIRRQTILFWFLIFIASFLREQIIFSILPLLVIAYIINIDRQHLNTRKIVISLLLLSGILFNHFSYHLDKEYSEWMDFTQKRAYYTDFGGSTNHNNLLTHEEYELAKTWWILDLDLYPSNKVYKAAGSVMDIAQKRLSSYRNIKVIFIRHPIFYWLLALSLIVALILKSWLRIAWYSLFAVGVIVLLVVKDVERVTLPIILLWVIMLFVDLWYASSQKTKWIRQGLMFLLIIVAANIIFKQLPMDRITHYKEKEALFYEFKDIIQRNHMHLEITSGFPASWQKLVEALMENHLFNEKNWVGYDRELLLSGWFTKSPFPYQQHNISFDGVKRKYNNFHEWMLAKDSGFIGSKGERRHASVFLNLNLMRMYDEKFPPKYGCYHTPVIVDQSKHFIIHRIIQKCSNGCSTIHYVYNAPFEETAKIWDLKNALKSTNTSMKYNNTVLEVSGNDPKVIVDTKSVIIDKCTLLRIIVDAPIKTTLQLFYKENKKDEYTEYNSHRVAINKGKNTIELKIPAHYIKNGLRIDPVSHKGNYTLKKMALYRLDK